MRTVFEYSVLVRVGVVVAAENEADARRRLKEVDAEEMCRLADPIEVLDVDFCEHRPAVGDADADEQSHFSTSDSGFAAGN